MSIFEATHSPFGDSLPFESAEIHKAVIWVCRFQDGELKYRSHLTGAWFTHGWMHEDSGQIDWDALPSLS